MSVNPSRDDAGRDPGGPRIHELVKLEFEHVTSQFTANEEMGEKRVALFVSLTAGLGAAAVLAGDKLGPAQALSSSGIFIAVNVAWLLFGYLTFLRIVQRNVTTDRYKAQLRRLRRWFVAERDAGARVLLPYDPYGSPDPERAGLTFSGRHGGKGGYAELVALIDAAIGGGLAWQIAHLVLSIALRGHWLVHPLALLVGAAGALYTWSALARSAAALYEAARTARAAAAPGAPPGPSPPS
jgi:hypothetical protein